RECTDLANLAEVSTHFRAGVKEFMRRAENRPGIRNVDLRKNEQGRLNVYMFLYPSNIPFYGLSSLDKGRFRMYSNSLDPRIKVILNGPQDSLVEQVSDMLSSCIKKAYIHGYRFTPEDLSLCKHLLRDSTIPFLDISTKLDDTTAPIVLSLASHTEEFMLYYDDQLLSDPANFVNQLASYPISSFLIVDWYTSTSSYFGLQNSFWEKFLNEVRMFFIIVHRKFCEVKRNASIYMFPNKVRMFKKPKTKKILQKLAKGSFQSVETANIDEKITMAPFVIPDTDMGFIEWNKTI
ncbi:hypothetical protein PMAYCL1PPCAC_22890, partial [Pristionchus mayeri]